MRIFTVTEVTNTFWRVFTASRPTHSDMHMLPYPIHVDGETGDVSTLEPPWDCFPDTCANVLGSKSAILPEKLTT